jgi:hypothetical protein
MKKILLFPHSDNICPKEQHKTFFMRGFFCVFQINVIQHLHDYLRTPLQMQKGTKQKYQSWACFYILPVF